MPARHSSGVGSCDESANGVSEGSWPPGGGVGCSEIEAMGRWLNQFQMSEHLGWRAVEFGQRHIADIADVFQPFGRGVKSAGSQISELVEELGVGPEGEPGLVRVTGR